MKGRLAFAGVAPCFGHQPRRSGCFPAVALSSGLVAWQYHCREKYQDNTK